MIFSPILVRTFIKSKTLLSSPPLFSNLKPCHHAHFIWKTFSTGNIPRRSSAKSAEKFINKQLTGEQTIKKSTSQEIRRLLKLTRPEKWSLTGAVCCLLISSAVTMAVPFFIGKIIDTMYTTDIEQRRAQLRNMCSFFVVAFIIGAVANFGRVYLTQMSGQRIVNTLRSDLFRSILKQEITFFDKNKTGDLISRLSSDTLLVGQSITQNISNGLRSMTSVIAAFSMMVYTSPQLTYVGLCVVPPVVLVAIVYGRFARNITRRVQDGIAAATQISEERISNIRTVRAFAQESRENELYSSKLLRVLHLQQKEALARAIFFGTAGLSGNMIVMIVLYYGGTMMSEAQLTVGDLSAFLMYAGYMGISLGGLSSFYSALMKGIGASNKLWQILDREPKIPISGGVIPSTNPREIEFRDVHFAFPTRPEVQIFTGLNLLVSAGSMTALVGSSGSGKSTIAALLLRYYDPQSGSIFVDGKNVNSLNPEWLRTQIGLVSQEPILFSCSVRDNITYGVGRGDVLISDEEIINACKQANALDFIESFPEKLDTIVGQQGQLLSGGQRQRIAIARALIKNPNILILDEATSALDSVSETLVQEALDRLMKGRTVITIAHRLSTIVNADKIAVLEQGNIVEIGNYEKLMKLEDGIFRKLIEKQRLAKVDSL